MFSNQGADVEQVENETTRPHLISTEGNQQMRAYKCILFDLDHTLWDYETNAREALSELYLAFNLRDRGILNEPDFLENFFTSSTMNCGTCTTAGNFTEMSFGLSDFTKSF